MFYIFDSRFYQKFLGKFGTIFYESLLFYRFTVEELILKIQIYNLTLYFLSWSIYDLIEWGRSGICAQLRPQFKRAAWEMELWVMLWGRDLELQRF